MMKWSHRELARCTATRWIPNHITTRTLLKGPQYMAIRWPVEWWSPFVGQLRNNKVWRRNRSHNTTGRWLLWCCWWPTPTLWGRHQQPTGQLTANNCNTMKWKPDVGENEVFCFPVSARKTHKDTGTEIMLENSPELFMGKALKLSGTGEGRSFILSVSGWVAHLIIGSIESGL